MYNSIQVDDVMNEVNRCLQCNEPKCVKECPLSNNIPKIINEVKNDNINNAYSILSETNIMPEICSRVCPYYIQCMSGCVLGLKGDSVNIPSIEKFISDIMNNENKSLGYFKIEKDSIDKKLIEKNSNKKIAIIGSGPAGIGVSYYLIKKGFDVTIFEKENVAGGILTYGIPEFRLQKDIVQNVIKKLEVLGVKIQYNYEIGKNILLSDLYKQGYKVIVLAIGLTQNRNLNIEGENLKNVLNGNKFLYSYNMKDNKYININEIEDKNVIIIGGGNVAIDCARTAVRLKAKSVNILYRRTRQEMPVSKTEYDETIKEGANIQFLTLPINFIGNEKIEKIECMKMKLGEIDLSNRRRPIIIKNSKFSIKTDYVINCIGSDIDLDYIKEFENFELNNDKKIIVTNEYGQTSIKNIFIAGDMLNEKQTVAYALNSGKLAGIGIEKYLS